MTNPMSPVAVLLDRDGVINENRSDYVKSWDEFSFVEGALSALRDLATSPFEIVVVTNQSAIGRNLVGRDVVEDINRRMVEQVARAGGRIDRVYYCPHRPDENCACRKPRPGLLLQAYQDMGFDLSRSFVVGDSIEDVRAADAAGCTPILVQTGLGILSAQELDRSGVERPLVVQDLRAAVAYILNYFEPTRIEQ